MSQFGLLRLRRFAPLFCAQFLGAFNDNVFRFALVIFVTFTVAEQADTDTRMLVVVTGAVFIAPFLVFSALAGQLADKYEKAHLIRVIKTAEVAIMGAGALGFWLGDYRLLLAVLFLMGAQSAFFGPLKYGILPQHLAAHELTGGNGLIQMATYVAILLGAIVGGALAGLERAGPPAVIASVLAIALGGRIAAGFIPPAAATAPDLVIDFNPLRSTWRILADAADTRDLFLFVLLIAGFWFVGATYLSVVPTYGKTVLDADEHAVTLLNAAFTLGIGIGSLACEKLSRGRIELGIVPFAALVMALGSFDVWLVGAADPPAAQLTLASFFAHAAAARFFLDLVVIGAGGALYIVPLYAALQARVAPERCARMLAAVNIMDALLMVVAALFTLALYALGATPQDVFLVVGILIVAAMLAAMANAPEFVARARALCGRP